MNPEITTELWLVLATMIVLLVFAIGAVVIFVRVWRKERRTDAKNK